MSIDKEKDFGTPARQSDQLINLEIDGFQVTAPAGTSVLRAAASIGIDIPKLCATDSIEPFGSCRLCVVEIRGARGMPASCTTPVAEGMMVTTQNKKTRRRAPRRDGTVYIGPSARLSDLRRQRRLRTAGHGRRGRIA